MSKNLCVVLLTFLSLSLLLLLPSSVWAQVPGVEFPCDKTANPEFHSLRPYQTGVCGEANKASFCGNSLIFTENYKDFPECYSQAPEDEGGFLCKVNKTVPAHSLSVDMQGGQLPILGNTQQVTNSQSSQDILDDAQKVNEYVSWYLNGVTDRAEYGANEDIKTVNFSGPIKKLLPQAIQNQQRIDTITKATTETSNQIVVCANGSNAVACPQGEKVRLKEWNDGSLSLFNTFFNWLGSNIWDKKYPPLPWQFEKDIYFQKAYNEWRGKTCAIVPVINRLVCIDNPLVRNKWADLFPYVPLSSTTDKKGQEVVIGVEFAGGGETKIINTNYDSPASANLYFAHTQEVKDLSEFLNSSYIPKDVETQPVPETTETNQCQVVDIRANAGDDLFPGAKKVPDIKIPNITYTITQVPCEKKIEQFCHTNLDGTRICLPKTTVTCEANVEITANMDTHVPNVNEIWSTTVADSTSTFRKIFPKVEEGAPVSCIADIPGATSINYQVVEGNLSNFKNPGDSPSTSPELYFPHLGGIYEYFLKGIQTALRPKGYGEPLTNGQFCSNSSNIKCGELPDLPKASGSCQLGSVSSRVGNIPQSLKDIVSAAAQTYKVPPNLILGIMYGEGLFDGSNKKDWTDQNVKNWATCQPVPNCNTSGDDHFMGFYSNVWATVSRNIKNDLLKIDPNHQEPSQCNLLDAVYGLAWNLHDSADGGMNFTCFGLDLNAPIPSSCSWSANQYESAIKIHETGFEQICLTLKGGCAIGGLGAACPGGQDNCEKYTNAGNTSHNACVWDVAHGN